MTKTYFTQRRKGETRKRQGFASLRISASLREIDRKGLVTMTQGVPNDNENDDGSETTSSQFFCSITCDQGPNKIIHRRMFKRKTNIWFRK
jgi:hypothetical protein